MTNAIDNNFLAMLLHPAAKPPLDPNTLIPLTSVPERMGALVDTWNRRGDRLIVPMPALAEFLVLAGPDGNAYLTDLNNLATVYLRAFDLRAAVELASMELAARATGSKKYPADDFEPWQKVKVDRQIVAIAKVHNVDTMYTDDGSVRAMAAASGMRVVSSWDLPIPPRAQALFTSSGEVDLS